MAVKPRNCIVNFLWISYRFMSLFASSVSFLNINFVRWFNHVKQNINH